MRQEDGEKSSQLSLSSLLHERSQALICFSCGKVMSKVKRETKPDREETTVSVVPLQAKRSLWCVAWFSTQDHSTGWGMWRTELCFYASTYIYSLFISSLPILLTTKIKLCVSWFLCLSSAGKWLPWDHQYLFARCIHFLRDSTELKVFLPTPVPLIRQTHTIHSLALTVNTVKTQSLGRLLVFMNFSLT